MAQETAVVDPVGKLADDFLARHRCRERPDMEEYVGNHPELVERIRTVFPTLLLE